MTSVSDLDLDDHRRRICRRMGRPLALLTVGGSHAYGTNHAGSDLDLRGIYVAGIDELVGLGQPRGTYDYDDPDVVVHELGKFAAQAASANPNFLEVLYGPAVHVAEAFRPLYDRRDLFLSARLRRTYHGFARNQLGKFLSGRRSGRLQDGKRRKHLLHCFRTVELAIDTLCRGTMDLTVADPDRLWGYVDGPEPEALERFDWLLGQLDATTTSLPDQPDRQAIHDLVVEVRWRMHDAA